MTCTRAREFPSAWPVRISLWWNLLAHRRSLVSMGLGDPLSSLIPTGLKCLVCTKLLQSCLTLCNPMDHSRQAPLFMGFSRQEYLGGLPFPSPGDLPDPGIKPMPLKSPALAGRFFITRATGEAPQYLNHSSSSKVFSKPHLSSLLNLTSLKISDYASLNFKSEFSLPPTPPFLLFLEGN